MLYPSYVRRSDPFALMRSMMRDFDRTFAPASGQTGFPAINMWQGDDASMRNGVLTITLPRSAAAQPKKIAVKAA